MTLKSKLLLGAVAVALAAGAAWFFWWQPARHSPGEYRVQEVARGDVEVTVLATGVVRPRNRLEVKPPLAGRAEEVLVKEGDRVRKGQILVWMSSTERAALLDAASVRGPEEVKRWSEFYRPTPVMSPIDGTVILRGVEPGQSFTAPDALLVVADRLIVEAQVDETDIAQVRPRQKARIVLDAHPETAITGEVAAIAYEARTVSNVTTYPVEVLPEKVPPFMRSGMTASVRFKVAERRDVVVVPAQALSNRGGKTYVLLPPEKRGDKPPERAVETGLSDGRRVEVVSGLAEGDRILIAEVRLDSARTGGVNPFSTFGRPRRNSSK